MFLFTCPIKYSWETFFTAGFSEIYITCNVYCWSCMCQCWNKCTLFYNTKRVIYMTVCFILPVEWTAMQTQWEGATANEAAARKSWISQRERDSQDLHWFFAKQRNTFNNDISLFHGSRCRSSNWNVLEGNYIFLYF